MIVPKFAARVKNGKLKFVDTSAFHAYLWKFKDQDDLVVTIQKRRKVRSLKQNSYYWGGVLPVIGHETGHSAEELHEIFKRKFIRPKIITYRGQELKTPGSTRDLSTAEFNEYLERIRAEAADLGINIPEPMAFVD